MWVGYPLPPGKGVLLDKKQLDWFCAAYPNDKSRGPRSNDAYRQSSLGETGEAPKFQDKVTGNTSSDWCQKGGIFGFHLPAILQVLQGGSSRPSGKGIPSLPRYWVVVVPFFSSRSWRSSGAFPLPQPSPGTFLRSPCSREYRGPGPAHTACCG